MAVNIDFSALDNTGTKRAPAKPFSSGREDAYLDVTTESEIESSAPFEGRPQAIISRLDQLSLSTVTMALLAGVLLQLVFGDSTAESSPRLTAYRVDPNTAGLEELVLLEGIGELTAEKIMLDREETGSFSAADDLQRVKGIGPKTIDRLRDHIVCR